MLASPSFACTRPVPWRSATDVTVIVVFHLTRLKLGSAHARRSDCCLPSHSSTPTADASAQEAEERRRRHAAEAALQRRAGYHRGRRVRGSGEGKQLERRPDGARARVDDYARSLDVRPDGRVENGRRLAVETHRGRREGHHQQREARRGTLREDGQASRQLRPDDQRASRSWRIASQPWTSGDRKQRRSKEELNNHNKEVAQENGHHDMS